MTKAELIKSIAELDDTCEIAVASPEKPEARRYWESNVVCSRVQKGPQGQQVFVIYSYDPHYDDKQASLTLVA